MTRLLTSLPAFWILSVPVQGGAPGNRSPVERYTISGNQMEIAAEIPQELLS